MKRKVLLLVVLIIVVMIVTLYKANMTPLEVAKNNKNTKDSVLHIKEVLYEVELKDKYLIIYKNDRDNICNALLEKTLLGYKVLDFNGEVSTSGHTIPVGMHFGWYNKEEGWVGFGVIYDDTVAEIYIDDVKAEIITVNGLGIWFLVGNWELDEINTRILDYNGDEVLH